MKKYILLFLLLILPTIANATPVADESFDSDIFKAEVVSVIEEDVKDVGDGFSLIQQEILLIGLEGDWLGKEFKVNTINDIEVLASKRYGVGDKVLVNHSIDYEGEDSFYIIDNIRFNALSLIFLLFIVAIIVVGRWKGLRSIISLVFSFLVIFYFIIPNIFNGYNPVVIALVGGLIMTPLIVYFTEGLNNRSHAAVISIYASLFVTGILSWFFIKISHLVGISEEMMFLVGSSHVVDFRGLLLAGMIIGSLGVLDDLVVSQISAVEEMSSLDKKMNNKELYNKASRVGVSHLGSMTNTLFLAYAGVSLPLLLLFYIKQPPFMTVGEVINSELIATEIIRTLVGSIGLILAMPISTILAIKFFRRND
ncbi:MAG: YibE/F family protein [Candidatus Komeilibacteria bacterium]